MTTQTPRRPEDYLVSMQEARASSPISHVIQEGHADIQEVLRQQYILPGSLRCEDRDQGYATSSNSEVYALGMFEVHAGAQKGEDDGSVYTLNVDGLIDTLPSQEAKCRSRLSQFSNLDVSQTEQLSTEEESQSDFKSDLPSPSSDNLGQSGSEKYISVHYASVSVPHDHMVESPSITMPPVAAMVLHHSSDHHGLSYHQYSYNRIFRSKCDGYELLCDVPSNLVYPIECQAVPSTVHSYNDYPENVSENKRSVRSASQPRNVPSARGQDFSKATSTTSSSSSRATVNQIHNDRHSSGCARSQSFESTPDSVTSQHQHSSKFSHTSRQQSILKNQPASQPAMLDRSAADRFMYGNFCEDRCSTCSSSSSEDFDYRYRFSPKNTKKNSYVDDMGIGGTVHGFSVQKRGRRHRQKNKHCVLQ